MTFNPGAKIKDKSTPTLNSKVYSDLMTDCENFFNQINKHEN